MKNKFILIATILTIFSLSILEVNASTNTKTRTKDNYLVSKNIEITDNNKDNILKTPAVDESEKIYDFANLFTDTEEKEIYKEIEGYINSFDLDLAIVTIDYNNKISPQEYADDFYDYNAFGINSTNDGILFLIDMDNREIYMSTTGNAIKMYNDYRINDCLDRVYQYMSNEKYCDGVLEYIEVISDYAKAGLPTSSNNSTKKQSIGENLMISYGISLVITLIVIFVLIRKNKLVRKATTAREYLNKESVIINNIGEMFIGSNTVKHKIEHDTSSGGSSTHSGSSGVSHGGGGHGF